MNKNHPLWKKHSCWLYLIAIIAIGFALAACQNPESPSPSPSPDPVCECSNPCTIADCKVLVSGFNTLENALKGGVLNPSPTINAFGVLV